MENLRKSFLKSLIPVLFAFFIMGFVDVVGISTSYVKHDFALSDTLSNLLSMMVFVWFAVFSLPTGIIMGKTGRKKTVLFSILTTCLAMAIPLFDYHFVSVLIAFTLLGIGNTILQVSLNPLLLDVVSKEKVTSMLTLGQFIKAISSTLGPVIASAAVGLFGNWQLIFWVYTLLSLVSVIWLAWTPIEEKGSLKEVQSLKPVLALLKERNLVLAFSVILLIVGFEIGLMTSVPKYLSERCGLEIEKGSLGCSIYFIARTIGTFLGTFILARYDSRKFLIGNLSLAILALGGFMLTSQVTCMMVLLFLVGLTCANVFPIIYSQAIQSVPDKANEISALMIMGVAGGAVLPMIMGIVADVSNQWTSIFIPLLALVYILSVSIKLK